MERISGRSLAARLFGASPARTLALIGAAWPLAVGPELARRTEVLGIEGGTLRVRVPDARWRKVLHRMQPDILAHLREIAGDLAPKRMGFVEGGLATTVSAPSSQPQSDAAPRSGGAARGGFQGGSRTPNERSASAPPEVNDVATAVRGGGAARGGFQGGPAPRTTDTPANPDRPQSGASSRSGDDTRGGFQGGSRTPNERSASAPPEVNDVRGSIADPELRQRFLDTMTRYLDRSKGRSDA